MTLRVDEAEAATVRCRFGCDDGAVGIFHVPQGCICWPDPIQALCQQHLVTAESTGPITCIVDLRLFDDPPDVPVPTLE